ncbi:MAG TPA: hypothetical protein VF160_06725 [Candidatus Dormibacteraeota bacterium]
MRHLLLATLLVASCSAGGAAGAQPQDVALRPAEALGLTKCSSSGTMDQTLARLKTSRPDSYSSTNQEWSKLKQAGARAGYFAVYSDDRAACPGFSPESSPGPSKEIGNLVVAFGDTGEAATAYSSGAFGVSPDQAGLAGGITGADTGLGKNSVRAFVALGGNQVYLAYWQHGRWLTYLFAEGLTESDGESLTKAVDARL